MVYFSPKIIFLCMYHLHINSFPYCILHLSLQSKNFSEFYERICPIVIEGKLSIATIYLNSRLIQGLRNSWEFGTSWSGLRVVAMDSVTGICYVCQGVLWFIDQCFYLSFMSGVEERYCLNCGKQRNFSTVFMTLKFSTNIIDVTYHSTRFPLIFEW